MHIVTILLTVLGGLIFLFWRMHSASQAAREIIDTADEARGFWRRLQWGRKVNVNPLDRIDDPREAAAAMMVALAQSDGEMTERERTTILGLLVETFQANGTQAEEFLAHARWLVRDNRDPDNCFRRLVPMLKQKLGPKERQDLLAMLGKVAEADGRPGTLEAEAVKRLQRALMDA
jgi:uncharacterized tellurite resistance protein B-like protein